MVAAVESLLRAVGQDPSSQELQFTAMRYVCWLLASTQGSRYPSSYLPQRCINNNSVTVNSSALVNADDKMETIMASELHIPFYSQCEHHLLPFSGIAHVGYFYSIKDSQIERSMVLKTVQLYSRRLQVQERLTRQIAEAIMSNSTFCGVMVVVEASHVCMVSRGVKKIASSTATVATIGRFAKDVASRTAFLKTILKGKADISCQC
ncbi:hypothetical protein O6H91_21G021500 [Diphasiastrum complanatum]|nr:hypothetical protein O6H91_21G021500 [Diphasiastrum complanatum]